MKTAIKKGILFSILLIAFSCNDAERSDSFQSDDKLIEQCLTTISQLYKFECNYLVKAGIKREYKSSYDLRADAFQEILKDLNRSKLMEYENINYRLADLEHQLTDEQKIIFEEEREKIYRSICISD